MDIPKLTEVLNETSHRIEEMKKNITSPMQLMNVGKNIHTLQSFGDLKDVQVTSDKEACDLVAAIGHFLDSAKDVIHFLPDTKEGQEAATAIFGAVLSKEAVINFTANLERVKTSLEDRAKKVQRGEQGDVSG